MPVKNDLNLSSWMEAKYLAWRASQDRRNDSLSAFARFLDVSQPLVDALVNGRRTSMSQDTADKIAAKLGDEIYDLTGLFRPDPLKRRVDAILDSLNDDGKQKLMDYAERLYRQNQRAMGKSDAVAEIKAASVR